MSGAIVEAANVRVEEVALRGSTDELVAAVIRKHGKQERKITYHTLLLLTVERGHFATHDDCGLYGVRKESAAGKYNDSLFNNGRGMIGYFGKVDHGLSRVGPRGHVWQRPLKITNDVRLQLVTVSAGRFEARRIIHR